jgi:hypothetical protein
MAYVRNNILSSAVPTPSFLIVSGRVGRMGLASQYDDCWDPDRVPLFEWIFLHCDPYHSSDKSGGSISYTNIPIVN